MDLINATFEKTTRATFTFQLEGGFIVDYTEFLNEKGKVTDAQVAGRNGTPMDGWLDEELIAKFEAFADEYYKENGI